MKQPKSAGRGPRVTILGGLNGFGMNCMLWEHGSAWLVDCGIAFPEQNQPGIDYVIPDFAPVDALLERFEGVLVTHAHEDHIGAIPFLLSRLNTELTLVCTPMTRLMIESKLAERELGHLANFKVVEPGDMFHDGSTAFEFLHVNHSIPGACMIRAQTDEHAFLFTGDWKLDPTAPLEPATDLKQIAGERPYDAVFGDSTNANSPKPTRSEAQVEDALESIMRSSEGRVIVAQFASNVYRAVQTINAAQRTGRRVGVIGRSLQRNLSHAESAGHVTLPPDAVLSDGAWNALPSDEVVLLVTGTQGEMRASLPRAARSENNLFRIDEDDTVVMSARVIPGNETVVYQMLNDIVQLGARVVTESEHPVHTSGHASRDNLKTLIAVTQPKWLIPIHGDFRARMAHADLSESCGVPVVFLEDGDVVEFGEEPEIVDTISLRPMVVEGPHVGELTDEIRARRKLGFGGVVTVWARIDGGDLVDVRVRSVGVSVTRQDVDRLDDACAEYVADEFVIHEPDDVQEFVRVSARRFFRDQIDRKPVVVVMLE